MSFVSDLFKSATVDKELDSLFANSKGPAVKTLIPNNPTTQKPPASKAKQAPSAGKPTKLAKPEKRAAPESDSEDDDEGDASDADSDSDDDDDDEASESGSDAEDGDEASSDAESQDKGDALEATAAAKKPMTEKQVEREKLQRTVFVGNVTIRASEKEVNKAFRSVFAAHGHVESIRFRSITFTDALPRKLNFKLKNFHPERDSCNAYVVFSTTEAAKKAAAAVNASVFEGKHLRCDYLGKTDGSEGRVGARRDVKRCVFVGNVPFDIEDEALWTFFAQAGEVESVRVIRDKKVGLGKGFAYVQFKERSTVPLALKLHETEFKGKPIRVFKCHKLDDNPSSGGKPAASSSSSKGKKGGNKASSSEEPPRKKAKTVANESNSLASGSAAKKRKNRARTSEWKKGHEQKKRKAAKELPRKLAKKAKKLATQPGKK